MPSTVISEFHYDPAERRLDIRFVSGRLYSYHEVPSEIGLGMARAFSKGEYFNKHIRDRYRFTRVRRTREQPLAGSANGSRA
jgi:hypothetical protein